MLLGINLTVILPQSIEDSGIGLVNTRRRLDLLYAERYDLIINETNNRYSVNLKLQLA